MKIKNIDLKELNYDLPAERIAMYPAAERDRSKLLIYRKNNIEADIFKNIGSYLPADSLLVFNNTRVINARLLFRKETGAAIEILCIEPLSPAEYELSFSSEEAVEWKCIIGNLKKWKSGPLKTSFRYGDKQGQLHALRINAEGEAWRVKFSWDLPDLSFGEVVGLTGRMPLPPYIGRDVEEEDLTRYQTIYSIVDGSVAAPTAGLHFTHEVIDKLKQSGVSTTDVTLHVGAGTFKPIKSRQIEDHEMHCEHFIVSRKTLEQLKKHGNRIIAVGTTSVRTLESLYWMGIKLSEGKIGKSREVVLGQWEPYQLASGAGEADPIDNILNYMDSEGITELHASTNIMIVPGYRFRIVTGMITNFHQPMSTLLLLISAWTGTRWKEIYRYALDNGFRFLSYGDCSLLLHGGNVSNNKV